MLRNTPWSKSPAYRFLTLCTMYLFFFNTITMPFVHYAQTSAAMTPPQCGQTGKRVPRHLLAALGDFFVGTAEAADDVRSSISPTEFSPEKQPGVPRSAGDMGGDNGASGSVNLVVGSYGYTYPIAAPPGRGGFAPTLALNYSSAGPNGSIGLGWDLSLGSISRSTKYGKPGYTDDDTFVISIKGASIMLVREGDEYRLKDEGLFLRIIKDSDGWVAKDKDGTRYFFGTQEQSRGRPTRFSEPSSGAWTASRTPTATRSKSAIKPIMAATPCAIPTATTRSIPYESPMMSTTPSSLFMTSSGPMPFTPIPPFSKSRPPGAWNRSRFTAARISPEPTIWNMKRRTRPGSRCSVN